MHTAQLRTISSFIQALSQADIIQQTGIKYIQLHNGLLRIRESIEQLIDNRGNTELTYDELSDVQFRFRETVVCIKSIYKQLIKKETAKKVLVQFDIFEDKFLWLHDLVLLEFVLPSKESNGQLKDDEKEQDSVVLCEDDEDEEEDDDDEEDDEEDDEVDDDDEEEEEDDEDIHDNYINYYKNMDSELACFEEKLPALLRSSKPSSKVSQEQSKGERKNKRKPEFEEDYDFF